MARFLIVLACLAGLIASAPVAAQEPQAKRAATKNAVTVVASFSILADLVRNVGGERVVVSALVGPNGDAHVYEPTPADSKRIAVATLVVVNGLGYEGWIDRLIAASGSKAPVVVASAGVTPRAGEGEHGHAAEDPHAWQSVADAKRYVANIRDALIRIDPPGRDLYAANAASYIATLDALDAEIRRTLATIPADRRRVITGHDAFGYFGDAYGIAFLSPQGVSTEAEPSARDLARLITQIRAEKISAVFLENVIDPRLVRQIARETGVRIGGTLVSDALTGPGGPAPTYVALMRHNARTLAAALTN